MSTLDEPYERKRAFERIASVPAVSLNVAALAGVLSLATVLYVWNLTDNGYGNTFYAAAVRSMTQSWHNFFFASYDPGGFITVDKPPVFLWFGAASARIFGYSSWSILLPSALAGVASVGLLWLIVRRYFGLTAATIAGLALALTPITVAVNRLNLPEPFLMLSLIGAAGAILRSLESRRWWAWTALAGFLAGVAFNIKMLDGWIPGPALAMALVVGVSAVSRTSLRRLAGQLAILGLVTLAVSASWMVVVDAWPASQRPYIGGSTNNTVLDLALGYNGFGRVNGTNQGGGGGARINPVPNFNPSPNLPSGNNRGFGQAPGAPSGQMPGGANNMRPITPSQPVNRGNGGGAFGAFRGAGGIIGGLPSMLRMFDTANGGQIGWLLPFAVGGGLLAFWHWRHDPLRRAFAALFVGWVLLYAGVFSYAQGIYHSYYTSALAPGVAAAVGVGAVAVAGAVRRDRRWLLVLIGLVALTLWTQLHIEGRTPDFYGWVRPLTVATALAGVAVVAVLAMRRLPVMTGVALTLVGLMLLPTAWSVSQAANPSLNTTLPQAGPQQGASGATFGSQAFDSGTAQLAAWLQTHRDPSATWQLAVTSSQNASRLIAQYNVSVMAMGGFMGTDSAISISRFADLVQAGSVRYVLTNEGGFAAQIPFGGTRGGRGGRSQNGGPSSLPTFFGSMTSPAEVMAAVQSACMPVTDAPSGYQGVLYDCAGQASALHQLAP